MNLFRHIPFCWSFIQAKADRQAAIAAAEAARLAKKARLIRERAAAALRISASYRRGGFNRPYSVCTVFIVYVDEWSRAWIFTTQGFDTRRAKAHAFLLSDRHIGLCSGLLVLPTGALLLGHVLGLG